MRGVLLPKVTLDLTIRLNKSLITFNFAYLKNKLLFSCIILNDKKLQSFTSLYHLI